MLEQNAKKSLIIVCDNKTTKYANYLIQLVAQTDNRDGVTVGTVDGSVKAAIYTEKQYNDTMARITSDNYILFLG